MLRRLKHKVLHLAFMFIVTLKWHHMIVLLVSCCLNALCALNVSNIATCSFFALHLKLTSVSIELIQARLLRSFLSPFSVAILIYCVLLGWERVAWKDRETRKMWGFCVSEAVDAEGRRQSWCIWCFKGSFFNNLTNFCYLEHCGLIILDIYNKITTWNALSNLLTDRIKLLSVFISLLRYLCFVSFPLG